MGTRRELIRYLPDFYRKYLEFQGICGGEQPEMDAAWDAAEQALDDQFIPSAAEYGLSRWETMLAIAPDDSDTLAVRRARILERLTRDRIPYTIRWLQEWLDGQFGAGKTAVTVEDYTVYIEYLDIGGDPVSLTDAIAGALEQILPVNLIYGRIVSTSLDAEALPACPTPVCTWLSTCLPVWDELVIGNFILDEDVLS